MSRTLVNMAYAMARPWLFAMDAERAHRITLAMLDRLHTSGVMRFSREPIDDDPVECMGLRFPNPVGLAAGMDKNAAHFAGLAQLGFGSIEVGTVTPLAQAGNPLPRMFRLKQAQALINRMGFNNDGVEAMTARLVQRDRAIIVGVNVGRNANTSNANALSDYVHCLRAVYDAADYVTINISSPNTRDLRSLQAGDELTALLAGVQAARTELADQKGRRLPIAVKIAPDLADDDLLRLADAVMAHKMDAIVATNTTISRSSVAAYKDASQIGGLSGAPLRQRSTEVIGVLSTHLAGRLPIIATGGILRGVDAVEKLMAGAAMVQIYTGLIYRGPQIIRECRLAMKRYRQERQVSNAMPPKLPTYEAPA